MLFPGAWRRMGVCVCGGGVMSNCVKIMLGFTQSQLPFLPPPLVFLRQSVTNALTPTLPFHFLLFPPVLLSYTLTRPPFSLSPPPPPSFLPCVSPPPPAWKPHSMDALWPSVSPAEAIQRFRSRVHRCPKKKCI